ncbi:MAG: hypothetical protein K2G70_00010 [Turicibacter sp.]|nr:hypothetical protein [Turicibacter sp.]
MAKNDITPISYYGDSLVYEEFNKDELKEAGISFHYEDDDLIESDREKIEQSHHQGSWWLKYVMLLFLVLAFLLIVGVGSMRSSQKDSSIICQSSESIIVNEILRRDI